MRFWCLSTSQRNWEICRRNRVWGMEAKYLVTYEKFLKAGDKAVVYTQGGNFSAVVEFMGDYFYSEKYLGWTKKVKGKEEEFLGPYRIKFKILDESDKPPHISFSTEETNHKAQWNRPNFIDELTFIADKGRTWNQYLQVSVIRITEEDFNTISGEIVNNQNYL